jgi:hypothetical protein
MKEERKNKWERANKRKITSERGQMGDRKRLNGKERPTYKKEVDREEREVERTTM